MGIFKNKYKGCSTFVGTNIVEVNPDPSKFKILDFEQIGSCLVLKVLYDSIPKDRFERIKIIVMKSTIKDLLNKMFLDPHFSEDGTIVARFTPTDSGWEDALTYARSKKV